MYNNAKQRIPILFQEKMALDDEIQERLSPNVFKFEDAPSIRQLLHRRNEVRKACESFMKKSNQP